MDCECLFTSFVSLLVNFLFPEFSFSLNFLSFKFLPGILTNQFCFLKAVKVNVICSNAFLVIFKHLHMLNPIRMLSTAKGLFIFTAVFGIHRQVRYYMKIIKIKQLTTRKEPIINCLREAIFVVKEICFSCRIL